jgi:hypothetical protein
MIAGFVGRRMISVTRRIAVIRSGNYFNDLGLIASSPANRTGRPNPRPYAGAAIEAGALKFNTNVRELTAVRRFQTAYIIGPLGANAGGGLTSFPHPAEN